MRTIAAAAVALAALVGLASCAEAGISQADAYRIGCPAVDAAVGGGSVVGKASLTGLKKLSESGQLDPEPQKWLDATISLLESDDPEATPSEAKQLILDGCAENGYPLRNLK